MVTLPIKVINYLSAALGKAGLHNILLYIWYCPKFFRGKILEKLEVWEENGEKKKESSSGHSKNSHKKLFINTYDSRFTLKITK